MSDLTRRLIAAVGGVLAAVLVLVLLDAVAGRGPSTPTASTAPTAPSALAAPAAPDQVVPGAVLPAAVADVLPALGGTAALPVPGVLLHRMTPLLSATALGASASLDVVDAATGRHVASIGRSTGRTPASTAKLLTAAAALAVLGPQQTLATRVVAGPVPGQVVLVGGGDVLLGAGAGNRAAVSGRAGLVELAAGTAAGLIARGERRVAVRLDDRLFAGPAVSPGWKPSDVRAGFVAPVQAVEVDQGWIRRGRIATRSADPALLAAGRFAQLLAADGIAVAGPPTRGAAARGAAILAEVRSATVGELVEHTLTESDNTVAEALARLVAARSNRPATFAGAGAGVLAQVGRLGLAAPGARLADGSGLGAGSKVSPDLLTGVLALAASPRHPELRPVLTGLPVAGVSGTLADRFGAPAERGALGLVRAKTGTLSGVSALAGVVVDGDGRLLAFAAMADGVRAAGPARNALDALATTLAGCGCR